MRERFKPKGESLIEVMITVALVSIVIFILTVFMTKVLDEVTYITGRSDLTQETSLTLDNIVRNIRLAQSLPNTYQFDNTTYTSSATTLIISLPSIDANNNVINGESDIIIYYQDPTLSTKLDQIIIPANNSVRPTHQGSVFTNLGQIKFTQSSNNQSTKVDVQITGQKIINNNLSKLTLYDTGTLRNL